jgi:hypothetical protein
MTPRTRTSNVNADFKVYYSEQVPHQVHFPHKRKTVRRPLGPVKAGSDKRQVKFLPEKMKIQKTDTVGDSEEEEDEDLEEKRTATAPEVEEHQEQSTASTASLSRQRGKKRRREAVGEASEGPEGPIIRSAKRSRKSAAPNSSRRSKQIGSEWKEVNNSSPDRARRKTERVRSLRRQSTMTQLVEGRTPLSDAEEPAFKPVKRSPRLSWSRQGKKEKDTKQRTLTQMIPGMRPLEIVSDEDIEDGLSDAEVKERDSQAYGKAITARLTQDGLMEYRSDDPREANDSAPEAHASASNWKNGQGDRSKSTLAAPLSVFDSLETDTCEGNEDNYQPTQFIDAPVTRSKRATRRSSASGGEGPSTSPPTRTAQQKHKPRFGRLSSLEKRSVYEIASSESPPDSQLSTQSSLAKPQRSPLTERSSNATKVAETPSKNKLVTFHKPAKDPTPPPTLRKFRSVIQDSEDEDDFFEADESDLEHKIGAHTRALVQDLGDVALGGKVGTETQAMLDRIDQACARDEEDIALRSRESLENFGALVLPRGRHGPSPELGEQPLYRTAHTVIKQEPSYEEESIEGAVTAPSPESDILNKLPEDAAERPLIASNELPLAHTRVPSSPPIVQHPGDTCPSTPMVIVDSSDEDDMEDAEPGPTTPRQSHRFASERLATDSKRSADANDEPVQIACSPSAQRETQQSHSSKAEQQLQNEWCSYSQYINDRPTQSSSMHAGYNKFSYDATPMPPRPNRPAQSSEYHMSQATTVEEVTPRKNRTQRIISASVTPHRIASSQDFFSPSKPPPLVIPSSFPSPAKARMEDWSSPVFGRTQDTYGLAYHGAGLEDFSVPPPPPIEDD